jgi:hypothetical protein
MPRPEPVGDRRDRAVRIGDHTMSEQPTPITDRPPADRPATEDRTHPSMTKPVKPHPARVRIATFDEYAEAERAVERLTSHGFPVQRTAIVGRDLRSVEQITGRLTFASAAWRGALSGALPGALIGWIFGLLAWVNPLIGALLIALYGLIFGAVLGAVVGVIAYAFQRGRRDFGSMTIVQAQRFDLVVDDEVAGDAARLLDQEA